MTEQPTTTSITCPICSKSAEIEIPESLRESKKIGLKKLNIASGIVCEHQFLVFLNSKFKPAGYEKVDLAINLEQEGPKFLGLTELAKRYGDLNLAHMLHGLFVEKNIVFIMHPDSKFNVELANQNFNMFLPEDLQKKDLIIGLNPSQVSESTKKYAIIFDPKSNKIDAPWNKKILKGEKGIVAYASEFLDPKMQIEMMQEMLKMVYEKAKFAKLTLEQSPSAISEKDLIAKIVDKYGKPKLTDEWQTIKTLMTYKLITDFSKLK